MELTNKYLHEQYSHITKSIPYSLHHTKIALSEQNALYPHWHHELELFYLDKGKLQFSIENEIIELVEGEAVFVPSHLLHKATMNHGLGCSFYAIVFSQEILTNSLQYPDAPNFFHPSMFSGIQNVIHLKADGISSEIIRYIKKLVFLYKVDYRESSLEVIGLLLCAWQKLYNEYLSKSEIDRQSLKTVAQLQNSIYYMHKYYANDITLSELADTSILSKGYYCKSFKKLYGLTPFEYLNRYRIKKACCHLVNSEKTMIEIMYSCGINNVSYFNRLFKKYMGVTPTQYKRQLKEQKSGNLVKP